EPPGQWELEDRVAGIDAEDPNDRADGRVPQQDAPSNQPAGIWEKERQQQESRKTEESKLKLISENFASRMSD
ncbi:MAG: hypothetical protein ACK2UI_17125, partial [Anaerolineae bacterium]